MEVKFFEFEIKELLSRTVEVEANTEEEAYLKVKEMYEKEEIMLDYTDYMDTEINKLNKN